MIDIGPNLSSNKFTQDLEQVIQRAKDNKLEALILTTTNFSNYQINLKIIDKYNYIMPLFTTYGLHPHYASDNKDIFKYIDINTNNPSVVAIGEFGLDFFRMLSSKETQIEVMNQFLEHAEKKPHLPLFLHERDSFEDFHYLLKSYNGTNKKVIHCFTGDKKALKAYLDLDCYIGITGWISDNKRNTELIEALKYLPLDKLMIETDCPYLTPRNLPRQFNNSRNEPAYLLYVAKSISEILDISINTIIEKTKENSLDFFPIFNYNNKNNMKL